MWPQRMHFPTSIRFFGALRRRNNAFSSKMILCSTPTKYNFFPQRSSSAPGSSLGHCDCQMEISLNDVQPECFVGMKFTTEFDSACSIRRCDGSTSRTMAHDACCASIRRSSSAPTAVSYRESATAAPAKQKPEIDVVTWNIAAPNNNPFEFWATYDDEEYNNLMMRIHHNIENPGSLDVHVGDVFTPSMFDELKLAMYEKGISGFDDLDRIWTTDLASRKLVSGFLKDKSFGEKRLISMPDRITSSIKTTSGQELFRPSPITASLDQIDDVASWWTLWKRFMFHTPPIVRGETKPSVFSLLETIPRAKYPSITLEEQAMSIPLQALCLAIFDAAFTHLLSYLAPATWQPLKRSLRAAICDNKAAACVAILAARHAAADVIFAQEASEAFAARAGVCLDHLVLRPAGADARRSQMSLVLARRARFAAATARDLSAEVAGRMRPPCAAPGDICVYALDEAPGPPGGAPPRRFLLASFHGDSAGRSTAPALAALDALAAELPDRVLVVGLDANTAAGLEAVLEERGLASCWAGRAAGDVWTTCGARTALQPQLHKAAAPAAVLDPRHRALKDWVLFRPAQLALAAPAARANCGDGRLADRALPARDFPSDHALVAARLRPAARRRRAASLPECVGPPLRRAGTPPPADDA